MAKGSKSRAKARCGSKGRHSSSVSSDRKKVPEPDVEVEQPEAPQPDYVDSSSSSDESGIQASAASSRAPSRASYEDDQSDSDSGKQVASDDSKDSAHAVSAGLENADGNPVGDAYSEEEHEDSRGNPSANGYPARFDNSDCVCPHRRRTRS